MKPEVIDSIGTAIKSPVTLVNAGALSISMMDVELGLKIAVLVLTGIWTIIKIKNELKNKD
jgi:hypothetical protein